jgi:hypothetical protein
VPLTEPVKTCGQCRHFPSGGHKWDVCGYPLPPMPTWIAVHRIASSRDAGVVCPCFESRMDPNQMPLPTLVCTKEAPNQNAVEHHGAELVGTESQRGCRMEVYQCQDCGARWSVPE